MSNLFNKWRLVILVQRYLWVYSCSTCVLPDGYDHLNAKVHSATKSKYTVIAEQIQYLITWHCSYPVCTIVILAQVIVAYSMHISVDL